MLDLEIRDAAWEAAQLPPPPPLEPAEGYKVGDLVRLGFKDSAGRVERTWLTLTVVGRTGLEGVLEGGLNFIDGMKPYSRVAFNYHHVLAYRPNPKR